MNFQPISLHVVNDVMIWYLYSQLHKINFVKCITLFYKEWYIMYKSLLITPHEWLYQNFDWPFLFNCGPHLIVIVCTWVKLFHVCTHVSILTRADLVSLFVDGCVWKYMLANFQLCPWEYSILELPKKPKIFQIAWQTPRLHYGTIMG